jgi:hypothetical protein
MANPPKQKGTAYETEVMREAQARGFVARRTAPTLPHDVEVDGFPNAPVVRALFSRPDRGQSLVTITADDFWSLLREGARGAQIECKRRKGGLWHHRIFHEKLGRTP